MDLTQLALTWVGWPNGQELPLTCVQIDVDQSEGKSSQFNASARKAWPNGVTKQVATPFGQGVKP